MFLLKIINKINNYKFFRVFRYLKVGTLINKFVHFGHFGSETKQPAAFKVNVENCSELSALTVREIGWSSDMKSL
jgi:hypothetical protein